MYADVEKDVDTIKVETMENFQNLIDQYDEYKRGYEKDINYPNQLSGIFIHYKI